MMHHEHRAVFGREPVEGALNRITLFERQEIALVRTAALAYFVALLLGYAYFVAITALSTLIQAHLVDEERGRVMALWIMGFGGTVPVGVLVGGWIGHVTSMTAVLLGGALWAVVLAVWSNAQSLRAKGAPDV